MANLEQLLALSNGMAGKGQMSDEYISQMLAKNTQQKDSFWNSPWTQIGASLLAGGTDANGIPISAGQAIGRGIQNVAAMRQKESELDNDRLRSAIWLRQQMGADKGVWMTSPDGRKLQVKPDEVQNYQNDGWKLGVPTSSGSTDPSYKGLVEITFTGRDGEVMVGRVPAAQASLMVANGQAQYGRPFTSPQSSQSRTPRPAAGTKPPTVSDLKNALSLTKELLGVNKDSTPDFQKQAAGVADLARQKAVQFGGTATQYVPEIVREKEAEWERLGYYQNEAGQWVRKVQSKVQGASKKPNNPAKPFM